MDTTKSCWRKKKRRRKRKRKKSEGEKKDERGGDFSTDREM